MGILSRKTKEIFCEPLLPSSLPYVRVENNGSTLRVILNGRRYKYTNYGNYKKLLEGKGYSVYSIEDLSKVIGLPILEVKDNFNRVIESTYDRDSDYWIVNHKYRVDKYCVFYIRSEAQKRISQLKGQFPLSEFSVVALSR